MKKFALLLIVFFVTLPAVAEHITETKSITTDRTITRVDTLNLYIEKSLNKPPRLLFSHELSSPSTSVMKHKSEDLSGYQLSQFYNFDAVILSQYSNLYQVSLNKNKDMEIKNRDKIIIIPRKILENPSPIDVPSYPATLLSNFDNSSFDIKVIEKLHKDKIDYFLIRAEYIGAGSNGRCGAADDESIRLLSIRSDGNMKLSSGFPYYSCYGLSDGDVLVYSRNNYYVFSDHRNIMVFDKSNPEWGFLVRELIE